MVLKRKLFGLIILSIMLLAACEKDIQHEQNIVDFESCWNWLDNTYPFFGHKGINWDSIYNIYKPIAELSNGDEFEAVLYNLLRELHDGHITLYTQGGFPIKPYVSIRAEKDFKAYNQELVRKYMIGDFQYALENTIEYSFISNTIGYMKMSKMYLTLSEGYATKEFDRVLEKYRNTDNLIIDVRHNTGGWAFYYIRRFINSTVEIYQYSKNNIKDDFISPYFNTYEGNIVILTNGCSFSAAEDFVYILRELPNVTVIGDTTAGDAGNLPNKPYELPSGRKVLIPESYPSFDGNSYEDYGVIPDILIPQSELDINNGKDKQIEYAISYLNNK